MKGARVTVNTTATRLDVGRGTGGGFGSVLVRNRGSVSVDLGGSDVTTGNGFELEAGEAVTLDLATSDGGLYGIAASGTVRCDVLQVGG